MSPRDDRVMAGRSGVAVVGGGPVGLTAALSLARGGIACTVIEADPGVCEGSRAICISRRSLAVLSRLGAAGPFLAKGLPWTEGHSYLGTEAVFHLRMPHSPDDRFPPFVNLQQYHAESFLLDACRATGRVDVRFGERVSGIETRDDGVRLRVAGRDGEYALDVPWVVAADGGRSFVREEGLGLSLEGRSYTSRYLIADIRIATDWPTERRVWFDPVSNPGSTVIMHRQPDDVWRIDVQLGPEEDGEAALREEAIRARIAAHLAMVGLDAPWELLWKGLYRAHTLSLRDYVHGRVIFAGDAAHLVPIFGVRGLNSGLDDAANLGWKLGLVLRGLAGPDLLNTYTEERRAACLENIESATKSTWFMSPPSDGYTLARDAVLELATRHPAFRALIDPRQSAAHRYRSRAIGDDAASALVGLPLPEVRVAGGRGLHDLVGDGFSVLRAAAAAGAVTEDLPVSGIPVRAVTLPADGPEAARLGLVPDLFLLVRPDGYVAVAGRAATAADLPAAVRDALAAIGIGEGEVRHVRAA